VRTRKDSEQGKHRKIPSLRTKCSKFMSFCHLGWWVEGNRASAEAPLDLFYRVAEQSESPLYPSTQNSDQKADRTYYVVELRRQTHQSCPALYGSRAPETQITTTLYLGRLKASSQQALLVGKVSTTKQKDLESLIGEGGWKTNLTRLDDCRSCLE